MEPSPPNERADATRTALALAPGVMLAGVAGGIAFPILPLEGARAGLPLAYIGVILAANRFGRVVSSPLVGLAVDRFGARRTMLTGLCIQVVVMTFYWLGVRTGHPGLWFLVGRLLHGPGSACVFVSAAALALQAGGRTYGGRVGAAVRSAIAVGVPIGLVVGGVLSDLVGDAATFLAGGAAIALAGLEAFFLVPDLRVEVKERPGLAATFRGLLDKRLAALGSLNFAQTFAGSGMVLTTTVLLVNARGIGLLGFPAKATAGACMGVLVVVEALSMPVLGRVGDRRRAHAKIGALGIALIPIALVVIARAHGGGVLVAGLALLGLGCGALGPSVLALVNEVAAPERRGTALGVLQVCGDLGGTAGPLVGTALFATDVALPYYVSAVVVLFFLPIAVWLARLRQSPVA